jgi:hypothetical protein
MVEIGNECRQEVTMRISKNLDANIRIKVNAMGRCRQMYLFGKWNKFWGKSEWKEKYKILLNCHHHVAIKELGHLLTHSVLTQPEVSCSGYEIF